MRVFGGLTPILLDHRRKSISSSAPYASHQKGVSHEADRAEISKHGHAYRLRKEQAPAGDLERVAKNPDPGQTSPPYLAVNSGYLQGGARRRVAISSIFPTSLFRVRASNILGGGRGGRLLREEVNGSWLDRDICHHGKHVPRGCGL